MKKWAVLVVVLYGLSLVIFSAPVLMGAFWDFAHNRSGLNHGALGDLYLQWPYWLGVAVLLLSQVSLLVIPVRASLARRPSRRTVWLPVITSAFMMALLGGAFVITIDEFVRQSSFGTGLWRWISLAVLLASWVAWGFVFYGWSKKSQPGNFVERLCRWLFIGSVLELLVALPTHIVARYRNYCCAGFGTFCGITAGVAIMLLSFGPGIFFLFVERWKRLHPVK